MNNVLPQLRPNEQVYGDLSLLNLELFRKICIATASRSSSIDSSSLRYL